MNPFEHFSLSPMPRPDPVQVKSRYLEKAEELHPDRMQGGSAEKEAAGKKLAEWNGAFEILHSNHLRLALLAELLSGSAPTRTGRVSGKQADRMMKIAQICQKTGALLARRKEAEGAIEIAMLSGEMMEALESVSSAQAEVAEWDEELEAELALLQAAWEKGERDPAKVESLYQFFSYAEKARKQLEERFLKLAENMG